MPVIVIAAAALNGVIGNGGIIPWSIPEDSARFRRLTSEPGSCVIMGRRTWESIPPRDGARLPGRVSLVVSSRLAEGRSPRGGVSTDGSGEGARFFPSLGEALAWARSGYERIFLAGGQRIYGEGLPLAERLFLTRVFSRPAGDRFFPEIPDDGGVDWVRVSGEFHQGRGTPDYAFFVYRRRPAQGRP